MALSDVDIFGLTNNFSKVKLLFDLNFFYILIGFSLTRKAPILLSKEDAKLRSYVF